MSPHVQPLWDTGTESPPGEKGQGVLTRVSSDHIGETTCVLLMSDFPNQSTFPQTCALSRATEKGLDLLRCGESPRSAPPQL